MILITNFYNKLPNNIIDDNIYYRSTTTATRHEQSAEMDQFWSPPSCILRE